MENIEENSSIYNRSSKECGLDCPSLAEEHRRSDLDSDDSNIDSDFAELEEKSKRVKERNIREAVAKVAQWRKLYVGIKDQNGKVKKYSLKESAKIVGIPKKTLDDYLLQITSGVKYGFDFKLNSENKMGLLRTFVKSHKGVNK